MNCVAIPATDDKKHKNASQQANQHHHHHHPLHIIHSEVTLTSPVIDNNQSNNIASKTPTKSQSLQRTTTTHLYCRSLDKDSTMSATGHTPPRRTSNSKGFASCLRGERDDAFLDYQQKAIQYHHNQQQHQQYNHHQQQQQYHHGQQQHYQQQYLVDDENHHPVQILHTSMCSTGSGSQYDTNTSATSTTGTTTTGRSEYKSKTLPRIHFDNSINDMSLNEGMWIFN